MIQTSYGRSPGTALEDHHTATVRLRIHSSQVIDALDLEKAGPQKCEVRGTSKSRIAMLYTTMLSSHSVLLFTSQTKVPFSKLNTTTKALHLQASPPNTNNHNASMLPTSSSSSPHSPSHPQTASSSRAAAKASAMTSPSAARKARARTVHLRHAHRRHQRGNPSAGYVSKTECIIYDNACKVLGTFGQPADNDCGIPYGELMLRFRRWDET